MAPKSRSYQISAIPITVFGHLLFIAVTTLVLVWLLKFREGLAFESANKLKIFNVSSFALRIPSLSSETASYLCFYMICGGPIVLACISLLLCRHFNLFQLPPSHLQLHPLLMVIGFILMAGEAIMAYKSTPSRRDIQVQKAVHLTLQTIALGCGIFGIVVIFKFHDETNMPDMVTLHSWLGMIAICLFGLQYLLGFFSYVFPGAESYSRAAYLPWHTFGGLLILFLAICTAEMGLLQKFLSLFLTRSQEALIVNFIGLLLFLFAVAVALTVVLPRY
ncbi:hypothetical protein J1N35_014821 [Gossypium stocksii]|uniref:ascorbate ferrireductase (transmembrane) n=1 Tax=Gossypium stocksii TaxID=47602 RepID=A0A9D3VUT3_9ROSI|nr:hypothetical protein J1N35_014821 [Gossypium stocksii]